MTVRYAPVGPLAALHRLEASRLLGDYHLMIAPIVLRNDWQYSRFAYNHGDHFVILDNGVIELGYAMRAEDLYRAAKITGADVVVMPDTIDDAKMTVKQVKRGLIDYRVLDAKTDTMGVVQGTTLEECLGCATQLVESGVDWLGVPRGLTKNLGSRVQLVEELGATFDHPMHILGFSNNMEDDFLATAAHPMVMGIDAATPLWAQRRLPLAPPSDEAKTLALGKRPIDYWESTGGPHAEYNTETVRRYLRVAQDVRTLKVEAAVRLDRLVQDSLS